MVFVHVYYLKKKKKKSKEKGTLGLYIQCAFGVGISASEFFQFVFSFFFFSLRVTSHEFSVRKKNHRSYTVHHCSSTVHALKNIKNGSHGTIHIFKNYFATVFSIFSFQFSVSTTISSIQTDSKSPFGYNLFC